MRRNGLRIAQYSGTLIEVVELFAFLHDVKRQDDRYDIEHGPRERGLRRRP